MRWVKVGFVVVVVACGLGIRALAFDSGQRRALPGAPAPSSALPIGPTRGLVVLDPGHGGTNLGAHTISHGVFEKEVTLALGRELREDLVRRGFDVQLTRDRDEYLSLRQRIQFANQSGADFFVSLHGNATETHSQRGFETYVLTADALDIDARALRSGTGAPRPFVDEGTALLLDDVERRLAHRDAALLARAIQARLRPLRGKRYDRGVRQGSHDVLMGATMPAVLVEVGFVDHAIEGHDMLDAEVQSSIAEALADAIASQR